jgi:hypothetical protein
MRTSEVLDKAADLIEERGWRQGGAGWGDTPDAPLCLEGGILAALGREWHMVGNFTATHDEFQTCPSYLAVRSYLGMTEVWQDVYDFNDDPDRTAAEVIEVLRACAVIEAAREEQDAAWETYAPQVVTA